MTLPGGYCAALVRGSRPSDSGAVSLNPSWRNRRVAAVPNGVFRSGWILRPLPNRRAWMPKRNRSAPAVTVPMIETFEDRVLLSTYVVTSTADSGAGSLRDAISKANKNGGADVIEFRIGSGAKTISPTSALPQITGVTTLDGAKQGGYSGKPLIEIRGDKAGGGSNGIVLTGG